MNVVKKRLERNQGLLPQEEPVLVRIEESGVLPSFPMIYSGPLHAEELLIPKKRINLIATKRKRGDDLHVATLPKGKRLVGIYDFGGYLSVRYA